MAKWRRARARILPDAAALFPDAGFAVWFITL
jgi:hypothetical protein